MMIMPNQLIRKFLLFFAALMLSLGPLTVSAEALSAPEILVKNASDDMLKALEEHDTELEEDPTKIYSLVEDILMPHFDFDKMSKLALGKNWRVADAEQRIRFTEEFRLLLIRTYSTAMLEYSNEEIRLLPFRDDLSRKRVSVPMEVVQPAGPAIPMALSLYLNKQDEWKVYDVKIDGISLVTNYRSSFANEIRAGGMDKLIEDLAKRNAKVKS
ncbi:MlaC/ttg2D family ABC transporter substrate-binding protein [Methylophaga sp.]|uniref:MlaC/ttg2D family ABC transporter substrate-binding protein n=1 Tax=Methylophaga sp. TaxID=2024840 RepID=UPI003F6981F2